MGVCQNLLLSMLVRWTSIYQLFWCSPGLSLVLTQSHIRWCSPNISYSFLWSQSPCVPNLSPCWGFGCLISLVISLPWWAQDCNKTLWFWSWLQSTWQLRANPLVTRHPIAFSFAHFTPPSSARHIKHGWNQVWCQIKFEGSMLWEDPPSRAWMRSDTEWFFWKFTETKGNPDFYRCLWSREKGLFWTDWLNKGWANPFQWNHKFAGVSDSNHPLNHFGLNLSHPCRESVFCYWDPSNHMYVGKSFASLDLCL